MSLNNSFGSSSFLTRTSTFKYNKPPHYEDVYVGSQADVSTSGSIYFSYGWAVTYTPGNPWTMTATIDSYIGSDNKPITSGATSGSVSGSLVTTTYGFYFDTVEKELLHVGLAGVNLTAAAWVQEITTQDKKTLDFFLANPPTTPIYQSGDLTKSIIGQAPAAMTWTTASGFSSSTLTTSIQGAQAVWTMTQNGAKTVPVVQPVLKMTSVVPSGYDMRFFTSNMNRVHLASSVNSLLGLPSNIYALMAQDTDPSSSTIVTDGGANVPLIFGWLKQPPTIDQQGLNFSIQQQWVYGLYYQNMYGARI